MPILHSLPIHDQYPSPFLSLLGALERKEETRDGLSTLVKVGCSRRDAFKSGILMVRDRGNSKVAAVLLTEQNIGEGTNETG